jgi:hypothetical protein
MSLSLLLCVVSYKEINQKVRLRTLMIGCVIWNNNGLFISLHRPSNSPNSLTDIRKDTFHISDMLHVCIVIFSLLALQIKTV